MEKEIINRKVPGFILSTFLFFFFYLLIRTVYQDIPLMYNDMLDAAIAEDESVLQSSLLAFLDIIMLSLSFWSIIRLLKGKPDCITCIRWALVINFLVLLYEFFCKSLGRAIAFHWTYAILPAASLLFTIVFFIYGKVAFGKATLSGFRAQIFSRRMGVALFFHYMSFIFFIHFLYVL